MSDTCQGADCQQGLEGWIVLFGGTQLLLSQMPDFHSVWWALAVHRGGSGGSILLQGPVSTAAVVHSPLPPHPGLRC
jgi:hypothetical protein